MTVHHTHHGGNFIPLETLSPSAMPYDEEWEQASPQQEWEQDNPKEECGSPASSLPAKRSPVSPFSACSPSSIADRRHRNRRFRRTSHLHIHKGMGLVTQVFQEETIQALKGISAIGHTRYSTTGSSVLCNAQPLPVSRASAISPSPTTATSSIPTRARLQDEGVVFETTNDSEVIAKLLAKRIHGCIEETMKQRHGASAGGLLARRADRRSVVGARDPYGIRPLCIGLINGEHYVLASKSCAFVRPARSICAKSSRAK